ncbi:hypothetical protein FRB99_001820 [Tulasnella sp. 403]|nr:hypothetical protein FRB99_001820 [Tulasnella sp. 403]
MAPPRPALQPARPLKYPYNFKFIKDFPKRLFFPPKPQGVGNVRSFKITPIYEISLTDVLDGKHLPPLTLKDFEDYLVFEAHSAENLYFICWFREYNAKYRQWQSANEALPEDKRATFPPELTISFARARGTFFDPSSHLELNLPAELVENLVAQTKQFSNPDPSSLIPIQKYVEDMLRESLMKFVVGACTNSGRLRGFFAIIVGTLAILAGLIPVFLSIFRGDSRFVRLAALPAFWFGALTAIAGFHGVCVVIFLFGDARQLYPYELARPQLQAVPQLAPLSLPLPVQMASKEDASSYVGGTTEEGGITRSKLSPTPEFTDKVVPLSPISNNGFNNYGAGKPSMDDSDSSSDYLPGTAGFIPSYTPSITNSSAKGAGGSLPAGQPFKFDFDSLPPPPSPRRSTEDGPNFLKRPMFVGLTKVFSPVVSRAQWEVIIRSAMLGVLVALLFGGICFALPFDK